MPTLQWLIALLLLLLKAHWVFKALMRFSGNTLLREVLGCRGRQYLTENLLFCLLPKVSID